MKAVVAVTSEIMLYSRLESIVRTQGATMTRVDSPRELPPVGVVDVILVDWSERSPSWADELTLWLNGRATRTILYGRHTDLEAHASARAAGLGPMWARSKLLAELPTVVR